MASVKVFVGLDHQRDSTPAFVRDETRKVPCKPPPNQATGGEWIVAPTKWEGWQRSITQRPSGIDAQERKNPRLV